MSVASTVQNSTWPNSYGKSWKLETKRLIKHPMMLTLFLKPYQTPHQATAPLGPRDMVNYGETGLIKNMFLPSSFFVILHRHQGEKLVVSGLANAARKTVPKPESFLGCSAELHPAAN